MLITCLISENLANKSSGMDQSRTSKFSLILVSFVLLGSTLWPICSPKRRATCAGVFPNFSATVRRTGFLRTSLFIVPEPGDPNGEYPWKETKFISNKPGHKAFKSSQINQNGSILFLEFFPLVYSAWSFSCKDSARFFCYSVHWNYKNLYIWKLTDRWTPLDLQKACSFGCCHEGWHSTWLTAGGTRATSNRSPSFLEEKLLTPIARALPES